MSSAHLVADPAVVDRARSGDRDALGELFRVYQPQVLRLLRAKRCADPDDVAGQVWIDVGRALDRFHGDGRDFQRWIFTIAVRRSLDEMRRANRRPESFDGTERDVVDERPGPESALDSPDAALALISSLPPRMAEIVMLRSVHGLTVEETAEIVDTSPGNVRVLTHRGLAKLRARLTARAESHDDVGSDTESTAAPAVVGVPRNL